MFNPTAQSGNPAHFLTRLTGLNATQRNVCFACLTSWTLDAFDFFILVLVLKDLASDLAVSVESISGAIMLTLAVRPIGALLFGRLAEKFGRRPILMLNIICFSIFEFLSAFTPHLHSLMPHVSVLTIFLVLRTIYGIAMGGIWGVASALAMESIPDHKRGMISGIFQAGYSVGYLIAALLYWFYDNIAGAMHIAGWQGMFIIGTLPILLIPFIYFKVPESPVWLTSHHIIRIRKSLWPVIYHNWKLCIFMILLMAFFNTFSHTQDIYPTFLQIQHQFDHHMVSTISVGCAVASIIGASFFGALSERIGRKKAIVIASVLSLPVLPLWAYPSGTWAVAAWKIGIGAFIMQFMVQGAWGVIPSYLNELSPASTRAMLPGFVYQFGNFLAAGNIKIIAHYGAKEGNNFSPSMMIMAGGAAILIAVFICFGKETQGIHISGNEETSSPVAKNG